MLKGWSRFSNSGLVRSVMSVRKLSADKPKVQRSIVERPKMSIALPIRAQPSTGGVARTEIAIAAIFRNEADYLKEWIEFHLMVGVDRLFLYDNNSSDNFRPILRPYIDCERAVLIPWATFLRDASAQRLAYAHAVCNCPHTVRWLVLSTSMNFSSPRRMTASNQSSPNSGILLRLAFPDLNLGQTVTSKNLPG